MSRRNRCDKNRSIIGEHRQVPLEYGTALVAVNGNERSWQGQCCVVWHHGQESGGDVGRKPDMAIRLEEQEAFVFSLFASDREDDSTLTVLRM